MGRPNKTRGKEYDAILGLNLLSTHHAHVDCHQKWVTFKMEGISEFSFEGVKNGKRIRIISAIKTMKLLRRGCQRFLAAVIDKKEAELKLENIAVVKEYPNVFPEELPGLPPDREIKFSIDLLLGSGPISKAPYRMAPAK